MLRITILLFACALGAPLAASDLSARLDASAATLSADVLAWRRDFHRHPELGNREFRTSKIIAEHLRALGMQVETGVAHTGVVALLTGAKPGPRLALRADIDALPVTEQGELPFKSTATAQFRGETVGVMHACGHDAHTAILMGAAAALAEHRAQMSGSVLFIFPPAEEGVGMSNTRARLEQLYGPNHRFAFGRAPEGGLCVQLSIPIRPGSAPHSSRPTAGLRGS